MYLIFDDVGNCFPVVVGSPCNAFDVSCLSQSSM